ncbi:Protocadherin Fat 4 [Cichlidogyrus casuarinus]|uniref:Protocadherin Fat 4 n=1 Tax=Cichlidogyrus casuarinus TaxID=1844966 RepID=A0ABD2PUQ6_9PLAT
MEGGVKWIGKLSAKDLDQGQNAKFRFSMSTDEILNHLPQGIRLPEKTSHNQVCANLTHVLGRDLTPEIKYLCRWRLLLDGSLYLEQTYELDREEQELYHLPVVVTDEGSPALSSTATVEIRVLDKNDNRPKFVFPPSSGLFLPGQNFRDKHSPVETRLNISMDTPDGTVIANVEAFDSDVGENARITYAIQSQSMYTFANPIAKGWNISFTIDPVTGDLKLHRNNSNTRISEDQIQRRFDKAVQMSFRLTLSAKDNGQQPMVEFTTLCVDMVDKNYVPYIHAKARASNYSTKLEGSFFDQGYVSRDLILGLATSLVILVIVACVALLVIVISTNKRARRRNASPLRGVYEHYEPGPFTNELNETKRQFTLPKWLKLGPKTRSRPTMLQAMNTAQFERASKRPDMRTLGNSYLTNNYVQPQYLPALSTSDYASEDIPNSIGQDAIQYQGEGYNILSQNNNSDRVIYHWMRHTPNGLEEVDSDKFSTLKFGIDRQQMMMVPGEEYTRLETFTPKPTIKRPFTVKLDSNASCDGKSLPITSFAESPEEVHTFLSN